jgi:hypothetical protein
MLAIRPYAEADREAVNAVARAAFAQYSRDYADWPSFIEGVGRMADLARDADVLVAEQDPPAGKARPACRTPAARQPPYTRT